jgi:hypothetical protein
VRKRTSISSFKLPARFPTAAVSALILMVCFELFITKDALRFYEGAQLATQFKATFAKEKSNDFDYIIIGHSFIYFAVRPDLVDKETGLRGYNFSVTKELSLLSELCILRNYLENAKKLPKYIIVSVDQFACADSKERHPDKVSYLYGTDQSCRDLFYEEFGLIETLKTQIPSIRHQWFFQRTYLEPQKFHWWTEEQINRELEKVQKDQGHLKWRVNETYVKEPLTEEQAWSWREPVTDFCKKYLEQILDLATAAGSQVIYIIPSQFYGSNKKYNDYIFSLAEKYPELLIWDSQDVLGEDAQYYYDQSHPNAKGTEKFSKYLAEKLKELEKNN